MTQTASAGSGFTYTGRILNSNNEPVASSDVRFIIAIYDSLGQCWLYKEQRQLDLSQAGGTFSFDIGSNDSTLVPATASFNGGPTGPQSLSDVFNNAKSFSGLGTLNSCSGTYAPNPSDLSAGRQLAVYFSVGGGPAQALPMMKINPVPSALTVEGYGAGDLFKVDGAVSQTTHSNTALNQSQYDEFWRLLKNPLAAYLPTTGDVTVVSGNNKVTTLLGQALPAGPATNGQVLVSNGASWALQSLGAGSVTSVSGTAPIASSGGATPTISISQAGSTMDGYLSSTDWNTFNSKQSGALADGNIWVGNASGAAEARAMSGDATLSNAGALTLASTITAGTNKGAANKVAQITYDSKGRLTSVTEVTIDDNTKLPLAGGTMSGAINMGGFDFTNAGNISMAANKYFSLSANATNGTVAGQMWYDAGVIKYFDGSTVKSLGVAGSGITNLNGLTSGTQSFAIGTSGNAPTFSSVTDTHTLNIPMASSAGTVTAGLISNTDYNRIGDAENVNGKVVDSTAASTMGQILFFDSVADKWKVSASAAPTDGQVMKWNDTTKTWEPGNDAGGWTAVDASYAAKGIVQFQTDAATSGINVASGVANVVRTTTGTSSTILSLDGSGVANMYGAGLKGATSGTLSLQAAGTTANYSLTFPAAAPASNQILKSDASGNLSWVSNTAVVSDAASLANGKMWVGNASGVASEVTMSGDATMDNAGALTLASTITAGSNKGAANKVAQITYDAKGRLTTVTEVTIDDNTKLPLAGGTMSGAIAMGGQNITNTGDISMAANKYFSLSANNTNGTVAGQMWYDGGVIKYFDGSTVKSLGVAGAGITNLNGLSSLTQSFAIGTSGNAPAFSSVTDTHTLNIPMASSAGTVTAGLLSNAEYAALNAKQSNALASAQVWVGNASGGAEARALSGDATIDNAGALSLASTITAGSNKGASNKVAQITYDAKGRLTAVTEVTIDDNTKLPLAGGTLTGDLSTQNINMAANKYLGLSANSTDGSVAGQMWYDAGTIKYFDGSTVKSLGVAGAGITSLNGLTTGTQSFAIGAAGLAPAFTSSGSTHTLDIPLASGAGVTAGVISKTDYDRIGDAENVNGKVVDTTAASTMGQILFFDSVADKWKVSASAAPTDGQVMKWNDTTKTWEPGNDTGGWTAVDASYAAKGIVQFQTDAATSGINVASGVANVVRTTTGTSSTILSLDGSGVANMYGAGIKGATSGTVVLQAPATVANYSLTFPASAPASNQILKSDASGNLSWASGTATVSDAASLANGKMWVGNASGVASEVTMSGDATMDNAGALTLADTITAGSNKGASNKVAQITYDAKGRLTTVTEVTIDDNTKLPLAGGTMSGAIAMGGQNITNTGDINMAANKYFSLSANNTNGTVAGQMWYDGGVIKYFDGSTVKSLGVAGAGITNLNGLSSLTQSFAIGTSGNSPAFSSVTDTHTLNIPMASSAGTVTAGLLSNAEYAALNAKQGNALASGDIWVGNASGGAEARTMSGDATVDNAGALTLASTITAGSNKGAANKVAQITYDAKGRLTSVTEVTIDDNTKLPLAGGSLSGDLETQNINMAPNKYLGLSANSTNGTVAGQVWYDSGVIKFHDGSTVKSLSVAGGSITSLNGLSAVSQSFAIGAAGLAPAITSSGSTHTLDIPLASGAGVTAGVISKTDYDRIGDAENVNGKVVDTTAASTMGQILFFDSVADKWKVSASAAPTDGQVMKWNDTTKTWEPGNDTGGWTAVDASYAAKGIVQFQTDAATSGINVASGVANVVRTTTGTSSTILSLDGGGVANMYGAGIKGATSGSVMVQAPGVVTNYTITLPAAGPSGNNQILVSNSSGDLSWGSNVPSINNAAALSSGKIWIGNAANVAVELAMSGDATMDNAGALTLANTITAGSNKGASNKVAQITYDAKGRLTAVTEVTIDDNTKLPLAGGTMSGAIAMGGQNITNTGDINMAANKYFSLSANNTNGTVAGQMWYDGGVIKYFDGSTVKSLGVAGAGITNLNGLSSLTQSFAIGTSGNAPAFSSVTDTHTLNIPMASSAGTVTAGLLSNAEYAALNAKQSNALADGSVWIGNSSGGAQARALSGDATVSNAGVVTVDKTQAAAASKILQLDSNSVAVTKGLDVNGSTSGSISIRGQAAAGTYTMTLPNSAGSVNQVLQTDGTGALSWTSVLSGVSDIAGLANGKLWMGNASGKAVEVSMSGDATMDNTGALTLANTITAGSNKGASNKVAQITYDAKGRLTSVTEVTIDDNTKLPLAGGTLTGDLSTQNINMAANKYLGLSANATNGTVAGQMWYDAGTIKYFDGSTVKSLGVAGAGITSLNGLTTGTQSFAVGAAGLAPAITSSGSTHTLDIPLASGAGVTAGVISKTDYDRIGDAENVNGKVVDTTAASTMGQILFFDSVADKWKVSASAAPADGQVMKWNDTTKTWEPGNDTGGWTAVDASYAAKGIVQFQTDAATSGINVASGVANVVRTTTGTSSTILSLDGSGVANMYGAGIKGATSGTVVLQAPATVANYSLTFPAAAPASNQILKSDASGNLSWVSNTAVVSDAASLTNGKMWVGNASGVASEVTMSGDATMDNAGALTLANTITAGSNKGASNKVAQITYDAKGRLTAVTEVSIDDNTKLPLAGGTMSGAIAMGGQNITNTGDINMAANKYFSLSVNNTNGTVAGQMWYDGGVIKYFDGSTVKSLGVAGAGITNLNGLSSLTQSFAIGTSGNAPAFSSVTDTHTLNIPMASSAGTVTAGLLSNAEYAALNAKLGTATAFSGDVSGTYDATSVDKIKGKAVAPVAYATGQSLRYDGTNWVNALMNISTDITGTLPVANGGTGATSLGSGNLLIGNGTSAVTSLAGGTIGNVVYASGAATWASGTPDTAGLVDKTSTQTISGAKAFTNYVQMAGQNEIRFADSDSSNYVALRSPAAVTSNLTLTLPETAGTNGQVLATDGAGVLSWKTASSGEQLVLAGTGLGSIIDKRIKGTGQVTLTNGSAIITGVGTSFIGDSGITTLDYWWQMVADDGQLLYISNITSDTSAELAAPWTGATKTIDLYYVASTASGTYATAFGKNASAGGVNSIAVGSSSTAAGEAAVALGYSANASANFAVSLGGGAVASGAESLAFGRSTQATGVGSLAISSYATASGLHSGAMGYYATASGAHSRAIGTYTTAGSYGQVTVGQFNQPIGTENPTTWVATDPLFVVGNGDINIPSSSNAFMILKNGNVGVGTSAPAAKLEVKGAIRMSGSTSGYTGFQPAAAAGSTVWTLPSADGTSGQVLSTNGSGILSWANPAAGGGVTSLNGLTAGTQSFAIGTSGNAPVFSSATDTHTLNIPMASASGSVTAGLLSNAEYAALNAKQSNALADGSVWIGNSSGGAQARALSGDATVSNAGVVTVNKTTTGTADTIVSTDGTGTIDAYGYGIKGTTSGTVDLLATATTANYALRFPAAAPAANQILQSDASGNLSWINTPAGGGGGALSSITAATATNTIDSLNFGQIWNWSTASTETPMSINANALTTGSILSLATSNASVNSTNGLLYVANTGASTSGTVARIQSNSTAGSGMTVLANGNVGIGTTGPAALIDVRNGITSQSYTTSAIFKAHENSYANSGTAISIRDGSNGETLIKQNSNSGTHTLGGAGDAFLMNMTSTIGSLHLGTNSAIRMSVNVSGNVGIGTTTPQAGLDVATTGTGASALIVPRDTTANRPSTAVNGMMRYNTTNAKFEAYENGAWTNVIGGGGGGTPGGADTQVQFNNSSSFGGSSNFTWNNTTNMLTINGDIQYTGVITDTSDRRLKHDIHPLTGPEIMDRLTKVNTYTFRMKEPENAPVEYGVMAQEVQELFPELVKVKNDEMQTMSVNYMGFIAPLIETSRQLKAQNEELRQEIDRQRLETRAMMGLVAIIAMILLLRRPRRKSDGDDQRSDNSSRQNKDKLSA